jgi:hypothetical protein
MRILGYCVLFTSFATAAGAQTAGSGCTQAVDLSSFSATDARATLRRLATITSPVQGTSGIFRAFSSIRPSCADTLQFLTAWGAPPVERSLEALPVDAAIYWNSAYPRSVNDAASWRGAGLNFEAAAGVRGRWRFMSGALAPEFVYNANADHPTTTSTSPNRSTFANPYQPQIDLPKRFGADTRTTLSPGQSFIRADAGPVGFTLSTENLWIGAAQVYPILLSNTAPGFPHLRIGTTRSLKIGNVVNAEFQLIFGSLLESEFFDSISANNDHYFATAIITLEPRFVPGLYIAAVRANHDTASALGQSPEFYARSIFESPFGGSEGSGGTGVGNAIGVLIARWVFPKSGFEAYAEWSREDTPGGWEDLLREPDWTQAYVIGFQKAFTAPHRLTRFYGELIHLGESAPSRAGRGFFSYYTHSQVVQGHTNEGQLLGAAIGPGSDAQLLGIEFFSVKGRSGARVERVRYDDDTYYRQFARRFGETRHDAEINVAVSRLQLIGSLEIEGELLMSRRYDRDFIALTGDGEPMVETNWGLKIAGAWHPRF